MFVFFDTSFLVDVDRRKQTTISLAKKLVEKNHRMFVSTITVSEIMTGAYLRKDYKEAAAKAKNVLNQFEWVGFEGLIAEKSGELMAYLISEGRKVEFQDVAIGASAMVLGADYLVTQNKAHFAFMKEKAVTTEEMTGILNKHETRKLK